jgi:hypothetical protein
MIIINTGQSIVETIGWMFAWGDRRADCCADEERRNRCDLIEVFKMSENEGFSDLKSSEFYELDGNSSLEANSKGFHTGL